MTTVIAIAILGLVAGLGAVTGCWYLALGASWSLLRRTPKAPGAGDSLVSKIVAEAPSLFADEGEIVLVGPLPGAASRGVVVQYEDTDTQKKGTE